MVIDVFKRVSRVLRPHSIERLVLEDAEAMMAEWGEGAYMAAAEMSWREDAGLIHAAEPGHWDRVRREIGLRQGWSPEEIDAPFIADRGWLCA